MYRYQKIITGSEVNYLPKLNAPICSGVCPKAFAPQKIYNLFSRISAECPNLSGNQPERKYLYLKMRVSSWEIFFTFFATTSYEQHSLTPDFDILERIKPRDSCNSTEFVIVNIYTRKKCSLNILDFGPMNIRVDFC